MRKTLGDCIILILSIIGSWASIMGFGQVFAPDLDSQGWIGVLFLGILAIFFLSYNFYLITKYRNRIRYTDIFEDINVAFSELHKIDRNDEPSIELIIAKLRLMCDNISAVFSKLNGHNIGVCIKFLSFEGERPVVNTLVRDRKSINNNRKTGTSDNIKHYLDLNSDFEFIYTHFENDNINTSYYYEPNLPVCRDYQNSRLGSEWTPKTKLPIKNILRRWQWPLPYRSTMVVPIVPLVADEQNQKAIRGFLCIDSPYENSFIEQYDVNILKGICDGLYNKIDILDDLIKNNEG